MKKLLSVFLVVLLSGCSLFVTGDYLGKEWPGRELDELINHWGDPREVLESDNGEQEIIYKIFNDSCTYTFYADANGIITGYQYKSTPLGTCKPIG